MTTNPLARLIADRIAELDVSYRETAHRSNGRLSYETVRNIALGKHTGLLRENAIEGLHVALRIPRRVIVEAMGEPWPWPDRFRQLGPDDRARVEALADELLAKRNEGEA